MLLFSIMARGWRGENNRKTGFLRFYLNFRGRFIHSLAHLTLIVAAVMEQRGSLASCLDFKARTVFDVPGFPTFTCSGPSFYHPARGRGQCRRTPRSSHRIPEQEAAAHRWPSPARGARWGLMQSCPALTQPPHRARAFGTGLLGPGQALVGWERAVSALCARQEASADPPWGILRQAPRHGQDAAPNSSRGWWGWAGGSYFLTRSLNWDLSGWIGGDLTPWMPAMPKLAEAKCTGDDNPGHRTFLQCSR